MEESLIQPDLENSVAVSYKTRCTLTHAALWSRLVCPRENSCAHMDPQIHQCTDSYTTHKWVCAAIKDAHC